MRQKKLAKKMRQNRPIPHWIRMRTDNTICMRLKTVLKADLDCLCEAIKSSAQFGVVWNITKVVALPTAYRVFAPPVSNCGRQSSHSSVFFRPFCFALWKILQKLGTHAILCCILLLSW